MTYTKRFSRTICVCLVLLLLVSITCISVFAIDTYESNDTSSTATVLSFSNLTAYAISYISTSTDVDWYKVYVSHTGQYSLSLTNNSTGSTAYGTLPGNYNVYVYNPSLSQIGSATGNNNYAKSLYFNITSTGYYYFKIVGVNGSYSASTPYKLIFQHGDSNMMTEACRYRDFSVQGFYDHTSPGSTWHSSGVAYSYGNKDSRSYYTTNINTATTYASTPFNNWSKYSSSYKRPGLFKSEYDANASVSNYCGIDCSGFIQRCAQAAGTRYDIARNSALNTTSGGANAVSSGGFANWSTTVSANALETGNIGYNSGHIVMFAKIDPNNLENCAVIEAVGRTLSQGGRVVMESTFSTYYSSSTYTLAKLDM